MKQENVENYATNTYDAVGLLIILCLIDRYSILISQFIIQCANVLIHRFSEIIPENLGYLLNALQKATNVVFTRFVLVFEMSIRCCVSFL